jgi:hypothetical protein
MRPSESLEPSSSVRKIFGGGVEAGAQIATQLESGSTMRLKDPFFAGTATTCVLQSKTEQTKRNRSVTVAKGALP